VVAQAAAPVVQVALAVERPRLAAINKSELGTFSHFRDGLPAVLFLYAALERLKKFCSHSERGLRGFGEEAGSKKPVTEPKRRQNPPRFAKANGNPRAPIPVASKRSEDG
jgi:hypothetical protein